MSDESFVENLYIHIPFCLKICPYCSFYKEASDQNKTAAFLDAVLAEAARHSVALRPKTVFFGGGTPTALSISQLEYLLTGLHERIDFSQVKEWTFEMNPATVSLDKAQCLQSLGVNRASMGVQAWQPHLLQTLGRVHTAEQAETSFQILRRAGFENINLDLIFGIPGQSREDWLATMAKTVSLNPEHISAYCLTYEEDTEFFTSLTAGAVSIDEDFDVEMFELTLEFLECHGYSGYEISNFSKIGQECRHNIATWRGGDYLGLGPGAFSTFRGHRWRNIRDTVVYTESSLRGVASQDFTEEVTAEIQRREQIAFGLRMKEGIKDMLVGNANFANLENAGLLERRGDRLCLTKKGRLVADGVAAELI